MRLLLTLALLAIFDQTYSQYYFNDIVSTQSSNEQYRLLRAGKIRNIKATSFEPDNTVTPGFLLEQDISMDGKKSVINTATTAGKTTTTTHTYENSRIRRSQSFGGGIENKTEYFYGDKGTIQKIVLTTTDTAMKYTSVESHEWLYNDAGKPISMLRIKNKVDTTQIVLVKDEKDQVVEEHWKKKNRDIEVYYYYYDAAGHLTDIVRYNSRLKKLIPDFQYEYDAGNRISQMTQIFLGSGNYVVWKYTYNEKGLKSTESAYGREKALVGRIEYRYE
jgi:YD repeat-containing protein